MTDDTRFVTLAEAQVPGPSLPAARPGPARRIPISNDLDVVAARVEGRNLAREMGFGIIDQARIATAISELARNVVLYAQSGEIILSQVEGEAARADAEAQGGAPLGAGLEIVCRDEGPGIPDVEEVMNRPPAVVLGAGLGSWGSDGGSREMEGVGMGLAGTRRLMDEFQIASRVGEGTTVVARRWLRL
jgi:serine/threonine-protein kinase RsbT